MRNNRFLLATGIIAIFVLGFVFLRGPVPHIVIAAEVLVETGLTGDSSFLAFNLTNTMITSWIVTAFLIIVVLLFTRGWKLVPGAAQNVIEGALEAFYGLVVNVAGEKNGRRFFPVVATIFIYVLVSNWFGLLPGFATIGGVAEEEHGFVMEQTTIGALDVAYVPFSQVPSQWSGESIDEEDADAHEQFEEAHEEGKAVGELLPFLRSPASDINTPAALAIISAIAVESWAIASLGVFSYGRKFLDFRGPIQFFVGILELISEIVRLISFTFRLFGNVFAGEVVLLMFTFLAPTLIPLPLYGLELFVGIIQAFIFAMLTLVFAVMALAHGEHEGHDEKHTQASPEPQLQASEA
jgi:F-type H+-transporting ATPase subunit a